MVFGTLSVGRMTLAKPSENSALFLHIVRSQRRKHMPKQSKNVSKTLDSTTAKKLFGRRVAYTRGRIS
jgi:hypothetical protein